MTGVNPNTQLEGFIVRDSGIPEEEWKSFVSAASNLRKQSPKLGINPFTRQPMQYQSGNFEIINSNAQIGIVGWEESECIWISGEATALQSFIALLCSTFHAKFEPNQS